MCFSKIYCKAHPNRATELIQYCHVIHTAAVSYLWDNVYAYDYDFRLHLGSKPGRSWAIILQQAWSMCLKDRIRAGDQNRQGNFLGGDRSSKNDYCKRFNKGRCTFGSKCRFEHRCSYCHKFGHGLFNCRKFAADKKERDALPRPTQESHSNSADKWDASK